MPNGVRFSWSPVSTHVLLKSYENWMIVSYRGSTWMYFHAANYVAGSYCFQGYLTVIAAVTEYKMIYTSLLPGSLLGPTRITSVALSQYVEIYPPRSLSFQAPCFCLSPNLHQNRPMPIGLQHPTSLPRNTFLHRAHHSPQPPFKLHAYRPRPPHHSPASPSRSQMRRQTRRESKSTLWGSQLCIS